MFEILTDFAFSWPGGLIEGGAIIWLFRAVVQKWKQRAEAKLREKF